MRVQLDLARLGGERQRQAILHDRGLGGREDHAVAGQLRVVQPRQPAALAQVALGVLPREVGLEAQPQAELARDPPARLGLARRRNDRLPQRHAAGVPGHRQEVVEALEVRRLGQHHVGVAGDLGGHHVHHHQQVQRLDGGQRLGPLRQRLDQVGAVDQPPLDRVRLPVQRRAAQALRQRLQCHGRLALATIGRRLGRGIGRRGVLGELHAAGAEEAAAVAPAPQDRVEQRDGARAVRVVGAVPRGVATGVHQRGRRGPRDPTRRAPDELGVQARLQRGPLGRVARHRRRELLEARRVRLDVRAVVAALADDHVQPGQQQRRVGAGADGQPGLGLGRRRGEARVHHDEVHAARDGLGEVLDLRVVHVLAQVRADEHEAVRARDVEHLGRAGVGAEREIEGHVARAAALGERGRAEVGGAICGQEVLEPGGAGAVVEQRHRLGPVLRAQRVELGRDDRQRLFPRHRLELVVATRAHAHHGRDQAVGVVHLPYAAHAARAQLAVGQRVPWAAHDLGDAVALRVRLDAALPEAHLAHRGHDPAVCPRIERAVTGARGHALRGRSRGRERARTEAEEAAP